MNTSLTNFKSQFLENILAFLWRQWSQIGISGYTEFEDNWIIDPEALLLFSLSICRYDARLFDEIIDWLKINSQFINVQRLNALLKQYQFNSGPQLSAIAEYLSPNRTYQLKWKNFLNKYQFQIDQPLFYLKNGTPIPIGNEYDKIFLKRGLRRNKFKTREYSRIFPQIGIPSLMLRLRGLFGVNARSELIALLASVTEIHPSEAARLTGYYQKTVQTALIEMAQSGIIKITKHKREKYYRISSNTFESVLNTDRIKPQWINWPSFFSGLDNIWEYIRNLNNDIDDLLLSSELKKIMKIVYPLFNAPYNKFNVDDFESYTGEKYIPVFIEKIIEILKKLNEKYIPEYLDYSGWVRRIDLNLRGKSPYLKTKIFKIDKTSYEIYVENNYKPFEQLSTEFDSKIRFISTPVKLTRRIPAKYYEELLPINDNNIPSNFEGIPFTLFDFKNHIESIQSDITLSHIEENHKNRKLIIHLVGDIENNIKKSLLNKLKKIKSLYTIEIKDRAQSTSKKKKSPENQVFFIPSYNSVKNLDLPFLKRDEELWFDKVDQIYNGTFKKNDLYFFNPLEKACFIDFSGFENINLRNHLLLYDTIYCALPIENKINDFWNKQKINRKEFLGLVKKGRLKVINIQPETRLDINLLREIYEVDNNAVVSRRALAVLYALDLVTMNSEYILNKPDSEPIIIPLATIISNKFNVSLDQSLQYLLWPKFALRQSFINLHLASTKTISNFGVNNIIPSDKWFSNNNKYEFEFIIHAEPIHIAHALDATYFPFVSEDGYSDYPYAAMMGHLLNFYNNASFDKINEYSASIYNQLIHNNTHELISIFDIKENIPILEFEAETSSTLLKKQMRCLFSELELLSEEERKERINEYNKKLEKYIKGNGIIKNGIDISLSIGGLFLLPVSIFGLFLQILGLSNQVIKDKFYGLYEIKEMICDKLHEFIPKEKRKISYLSRISRIASLKKTFNDG